MTAHCDFCGRPVADEMSVAVDLAILLPFGKPTVEKKIACSRTCPASFIRAVSADLLISKHFLETGWLLEIENLKAENRELRERFGLHDAARPQDPAATSAGDLRSVSRASTRSASSGRREAVSVGFSRGGKGSSFRQGRGVQSSLAPSGPIA